MGLLTVKGNLAKKAELTLEFHIVNALIHYTYQQMQES